MSDVWHVHDGILTRPISSSHVTHTHLVFAGTSASTASSVPLLPRCGDVLSFYACVCDVICCVRDVRDVLCVVMSL